MLNLNYTFGVIYWMILYMENIIRKLRKERGWTQENLMERLGWSQPDVSRAERENTGLTLEKIRKLADVFSVSPALFVCDDTDEATRLQPALRKVDNPDRLAEFLFAGLTGANGKVTPEAAVLIKRLLTPIIDDDAKHEGIKSPERYVEMALAFLKQAEKEKQ